MAKQHHIEVKKTAVYYTLGNLNNAKKIWFVLHGYGYSAKYFIKKFEPLVNEETAIIAPEGLSKFYLKGVDGRIGSSWMTKEDRENEIKDYVNYLNQLYNEVVNDATIKVNIVGFSQGGATASRWIADNKVKIDNFILWSSIFPKDMNFSSFGKDFTSFIIYGNKDEYGKPERFIEQGEILMNQNIESTVIEFNGNHDIPEKILLEQTKRNNWD